MEEKDGVDVYAVDITERVTRRVRIKARSAQEAVEYAAELCNDGVICLDEYEDCDDVGRDFDCPSTTIADADYVAPGCGVEEV